MIRKKMFLRSVALFLTASMLVIGGCGQTAAEETKEAAPEKTEEAAPETEAAEAEAVAPAEEAADAGEERVTLTIAKKSSSNVVDYDTNYYTQYIEDLANVDIEFVLLPEDSTERAQKLSMMVSSGQELPDIIMDPLSDVWGFVEAGAIIPLEDYLNDAELMPYLHTNVPEETRELFQDYLRQPDGHVYSGASYAPEYTNEYSRKAFINQTWLDQLGLDMPTTTDELYDVLKAFKENDLNGNGEADEIPMMGANTTNANPTIFLMNAFIYMDNNHEFLYVEDGQIKPAFTDERFLEGLTYVNKLVNEGLLSPLSFTQSGDQFKAIADGETQVIGAFTRASTSNYSNTDNKMDMVLLEPLTGPNGDCYAYYNPATPTGYFYVTKDCDNVEAAMRLMDACYDTTASMITRYGEPEVHWTLDVPEGLTTTYADSLGIEPSWYLLENIWGVPQNSHWGGDTPRYTDRLGKYSPYACGTEDNEMLAKEKNLGNFVVSYADKHPEELIVGMIHTSEEKAEYTDLKTAIKTYVTACIDQFAVGEMPLSEWDNYLKELDNMGLERFLELSQIGYDRYNQ